MAQRAMTRSRKSATLALAAALFGAVSPAVMAADANFEGVWNRYPAYADTFSGEPDPPELQLVEPPLKEPYLTRWRALQERRAAADEAGTPLVTDSARCLPEGAPGIMGAHYALQILQNPNLDQITVLGEFMMQTRRIYLNEDMPPLDEINPGYFGYSTGTWDGDVLEVTTRGIVDELRYADIPHSAQMTVKERLYLDEKGILHDDVTVIDPEYMTKPYEFSFMYSKEPKSYKIAEYVCKNDHMIINDDGTLDVAVIKNDTGE